MAIKCDKKQASTESAPSPEPILSAAAQPTPPSAPPLLPSTYSAQNPSDLNVTFVLNETQQNVTGNRSAIISASTELARIIETAVPVNGCYPISGIEKNNLINLVNFSETNAIDFDNVDDCLHKLELAKRYGCPALIVQCVQYIDLKLSTINIIKIFRSIRYYVVAATPIKKPLAKRTPDESLEALLYNIYQFIDMNADVILQRDDILDLNFTEFEVIMKREYLITPETIIFNAVANWSRSICQNRKLELTPDNRRKVLGSLCYVPRYLQMTLKEFESACQRCEILDEDEVNLIREAFKGTGNSKSSNNNTSITEQDKMLLNFKKPRSKVARMPVHLSDRSHPKNYSKKMKKFEQSFDEEVHPWYFGLCMCYATICD